MQYFVYVLRNNQDKTWYIGFTTNLDRRFKDHQNGESPYTSKNKYGWEIIYSEIYLNKMDALGREKFLKSGSGHRFLKKQLKNYL